MTQTLELALRKEERGHAGARGAGKRRDLNPKPQQGMH